MRNRLAMSAWCLFLVAFFCLPALAQGASYIPDDCGSDPCTCFIQLGDAGGFVKGVIELLVDKGYLGAKVKTAQFTGEVERAVLQFQADNGLPTTGTMDDDTLTLLIWDMMPEELDLLMPVDSRHPETFPDMAYVPTDGGKKRHASPDCSGMYDPRKVSIRNAAKLGYDACKRCEADRELLLH